MINLVFETLVSQTSIENPISIFEQNTDFGMCHLGADYNLKNFRKLRTMGITIIITMRKQFSNRLTLKSAYQISQRISS